jgi:hypothetical protein
MILNKTIGGLEMKIKITKDKSHLCWYAPQTNTILLSSNKEIWDKMSFRSIVWNICHESLHAVLYKIMGYRTCYYWDFICKYITKKEKYTLNASEMNNPNSIVNKLWGF